MRAKIDLSGQKFGCWSVLEAAPSVNQHSYWLCECICGKRRALQGGALRRRRTTSCGCASAPAARLRATKHGLHGHKGYKSWQSLRQRCTNPRDNAYPIYGGRGIKVCPAWDASFEAFWVDMGSTWFLGGTIERKDSNGNYEPDNCIWVTKAQQPKNRRNVPILETPWGQMLLPEAAKHVGLSVVQMQVRYRKGWRGDKLFSPPAEKGARITPRVHKAPD